MTVRPSLACQNTVRADLGRACHTRLRHQERVFADLHAVRYLHEVVELAPFANHRLSERSSIDFRQFTFVYCH